jgi:DNA (cytosine-5)-methyltransferase 1
MVKEPTFISLFAGCGGSSLGYKWAGFKELLAIEWDSNAVETFKLNFPEIPVWQRDIKTVQAKEIREFLNIGIGELDLLDGSPPCQGFSTAGKRIVSDARNDLFQEYARLVNDLQPKVFVMENVSGMIKGKMKGKFIEIMQVLKSMNYNVKAKLMNAMYYNVPQSRQRMIFIGVRKDLNIEPSFPLQNNKVITVKEALNNVINEQWELDWTNHIKNSVIYSRICKMKCGENYQKYSPHGSGFTLSRNYLNKPSCTITKTVYHSASSDGTLHPTENRKHTITEIKRLSSFPDYYITTGTFQEQWARIGNAVMPKFMQAIAENIKENILNNCIE